jgi:hypothetical protein
MAGSSPRGTYNFAKGYALSNPKCSSAGKAPLQQSGAWLMHDSSIYRGYTIYLSQGLNWSFTATPLTSAQPIGERQMGGLPLAGHSAKREIDDLLKY